jgi:hypothetical protein
MRRLPDAGVASDFDAPDFAAIVFETNMDSPPAGHFVTRKSLRGGIVRG